MAATFDVTSWLKSLGLEKYAPTFVENGADQPNVIAALSGDELKDDLGVKAIGDRKKILLAAEAFKGTPVASTPAPAASSAAASTSAAAPAASKTASKPKPGDIRSVRYRNGKSDSLGETGFNNPPRVFQGMIAQDASDPYHLALLAEHSIDFYNPADDIPGFDRQLHSPYERRDIHLWSFDIVANQVLGTGGSSLASYADDAFVTLWDLETGNNRVAHKFPNECSFTAGVILEPTKALVAKYSVDNNLFLVDLERGFVSARYNNNREHYNKQLLRDPVDPNLVCAMPFQEGSVDVWDIRQNGKAPARAMYWPEKQPILMAKPRYFWNDRALVIGLHDTILVSDIGSGKPLKKISVPEGMHGLTAYGNVVATTTYEEWRFWDLTDGDQSKPTQKLNAEGGEMMAMNANNVYVTNGYRFYHAIYD